MHLNILNTNESQIPEDVTEPDKVPVPGVSVSVSVSVNVNYHFVQLHHMRRRASSSLGKTQIHPQGIPQDPTGIPQGPTGIPQDPTGIPPGSGAIWGDNECAPIVRRPDPDYLHCSAQNYHFMALKRGVRARKNSKMRKLARRPSHIFYRI